MEYPITDFKKIKAMKHATHCEEILLFTKMAVDRFVLTRDFKDFVAQADAIFETYHKRVQYPSVTITKFALRIT